MPNDVKKLQIFFYQKKLWVFSREYKKSQLLSKGIYVGGIYEYGKKTNEPHKFVYNLLQRLDIRSSDKHVAVQKLSIHYTLQNIRM